MAALAGLLALAFAAHAQSTGATRNIEFRFTPGPRTQIALWIETPDGTFLKTIRLTQSVAYRGIGNRPGAAQMNSGFRWPYGRREGTLPIWAHRRAAAPGAKNFRRVIFQDRDSEGFASRTSNDSSLESYFCLSFKQAATPELRRQEALDAVTCASRFMSDKGRYLKDSETAYAEPALINGDGVMRAMDFVSLYPPRRDVQPCDDPSGACSVDTADVATFDADAREVIPDIDAISMATPPADVEQVILFTVPAEWAEGAYVAWMEVNAEGQYNDTFNDRTFPTPTLPSEKWDSWAISSGYAYRGQPSVVYRVPFTLGAANTYGAVNPAYYGDVDGFGSTGGDLHSFDGSITNDPGGAPGQGADRLRLIAPRPYRLEVSLGDTQRCLTHDPPRQPQGISADRVGDGKHSHEWGKLGFVAADSELPLSHYEVRFSANPIVEGDSSTFERALPAVAASLESEALTVPSGAKPGTSIEVKFGGMNPLTRYYVAVRAVDVCNVAGPFAVATLTTTQINFTKLSGCFVATAAYGSAMQPQVEAMRRARDALREKSPLFALATDLYYRSGPAAAEVVARSTVARALVRRVLAPVVEVAQSAFPSVSAGAVVSFSR